MPTKNKAQQVLDAASKFVTKQKGNWDHEGWEDFLAEVQKMGLDLGDEARRNLGNMLEAAKYFYALDPTPAATPKAKAKPKAKAAAKPKAKAKPKTK